MKNIYLCGFMGCGKSTVGLELAPLLNMKFVDMDTYIESKACENIQEIFKNYGEAYFRNLEQKAAFELSHTGGLVVATGGGAVLSDTNAAAFKAGGLIILIDVPFEILTSRLKDDTTRPLLQKRDKNAAMRALYDTRMPLYRAVCDIAVTNLDDRPGLLMAHEIAAKLKDNGML